MEKSNHEFQLIIGLATGLFFGAYSYSFFWTFIYIIFFEYYVFCCSILYPPGENLEDRVLINAVFIFSWILSRFLFIRETGVEPAIRTIEQIWGSI